MPNSTKPEDIHRTNKLKISFRLASRFLRLTAGKRSRGQRNRKQQFTIIYSESMAKSTRQLKNSRETHQRPMERPSSRNPATEQES
uniref:Uncharacterized protein n=1 Tax=Cucumis melo TaxID=3656 RepID=A0A9I9CQM4_CUCME